MLAYAAASIGLVGSFGYFTSLVLSGFCVNVPWEICAAVGIVAMAALGYRQIDVSARVLSVLMVCEVGILAVLDAAVLAVRGGDALPVASFSPQAFVGPGIGVSLMFAFVSFIGFESPALYGEESRNPKRGIPLATYLSVVVIAVFYALTSWVGVGAIGPDRLQQVAGKQQGTLFIGLAGNYLGTAAAGIMEILLCTSLFASMLAIHNATNRYLFTLSGEGVLPRFVATTHPKHGSPHRASLALTVVTVAVVAAFAVAGLDPYTSLATTMTDLGTLGIIVLQASAAVSVIGFFRGRGNVHWWRNRLAPALGVLGLVASAVLVPLNFGSLTGSRSRSRRPARYRELAAVADQARDDRDGGDVSRIRPVPDVDGTAGRPDRTTRHRPVASAAGRCRVAAETRRSTRARNIKT